MKTSVISDEFRARYLSNPNDPKPSKAPRGVRRAEDYHHRIDDPAVGITPKRCCSCAARGPSAMGAAEVVNMRPPAYLITEGVSALPCIGDGRQSGTSGSPRSSTPARSGGDGRSGLLETGDRCASTSGRARQRAGLRRGTGRAPGRSRRGGYPYPASQTPWQEIQRAGRPDEHRGDPGRR
jgi:dihydroxy-acid dehydratase